MKTARTGGQILVDCLETLGTERVFCVPGESYLPVLDALHSSPINTVVCRQEGGAAMMAEATAKLTGTPGICFVTRGPGACNASAGLHIAAQDSTPMLLFIGQVGSDIREREAFQEVDYQQMFGEMAKWVVEIDSADRVSEFMHRAFHTACSGRPGPVVVVLPEDTLKATSNNTMPMEQVFVPIDNHPSTAQIALVVEQVKTANNPIAIIGGSKWSAVAVQQFTHFAERYDLPVAVSFRRQMLFDHRHRLYAGDVGIGINPKLKQRIEQADLILLLGTRLSEMASQNYTLIDTPYPQQNLIHVHPGSEELGRVYQAAEKINASPSAFCHALNGFVNGEQTPIQHKKQTDGEIPETAETAVKLETSETSETVDANPAHHDYIEWSKLSNTLPEAELMRSVMAHLKLVAQDAVICNGAGNYASWIHRYWHFGSYGSQLAPTSGSMGYGLPAAIAAKLESPEKTVIAFAGDGCFQMTFQEFGTAIQSQAAVIVIVVDNGMYGTIRMHQEMFYPGRVSATDLSNPDFARWASAYGAFAATVETEAQFIDAFSNAVKSKKASLIHVMANPKAVTPTKLL